MVYMLGGYLDWSEKMEGKPKAIRGQIRYGITCDPSLPFVCCQQSATDASRNECHSLYPTNSTGGSSNGLHLPDDFRDS